MLCLKNILKEYLSGDYKVQALKNVELEFRKSEFVSILGPSGCGKTTLLNIIGGLDRYTTGDLIINKKSTKDFTDRDWDMYRNHTVGFIFQSYNLIPHQTVLSNVELALTLSGVSKTERRKRSIEVLKSVGLGDQMDKKPNQMSGGQMQRVAIARALVNNPDILLADEPTGALDSETSVQIMEILKNISANKLIIMVTHNPELAEKYSNRIIKLLDGKIISDSNPYHAEETMVDKTQIVAKKPSMSLFTAMSLSLNNLMTKKTRTFLTSFAGSIGIIGIALILALSSGATDYINRVQTDTLSSYPLIIEEATVDVTSLLTSMAGRKMEEKETEHDADKIYSKDVMTQMMKTTFAEVTSNDLKSFKNFIESDESGIKPLASDVRYAYNIDMNIYKEDADAGIIQVNPSKVLDFMGNMPVSEASASSGMMPQSFSNSDVWKQLMGNEKLLNSQYDVLAGHMPKSFDEVVLIVNKDNEITDYTLYALGLRDSSRLEQLFQDMLNGDEEKTELIENSSYTYDELLDLRFRLVLNTEYYKQDDNEIWVDYSGDENYMKTVFDGSPEIKVVGIIRPSDEMTTSNEMGTIGYTSALTEYIIKNVNDSEIVKTQKSSPDTDIFTGKPFAVASDGNEIQKSEFDISVLSPEQQAYFTSLSDEEKAKIMQNYAESQKSTATYEGNLNILGVVDIDSPSMISIYPYDFESKEAITDIIDDYNEGMIDSGKDEYVINYTDYIGLLLSSVTTIINAISYILIAFVAISLVVSSIMIGIITYISVLERTKEIGILRSIGASKKDISRVFNAETLIVGFTAGMIGIVVTLLMIIPINLIILNFSGVANLANLPLIGGVMLVIISMFLTFVSGLIPSRFAAKKDPVEALRTE